MDSNNKAYVTLKFNGQRRGKNFKWNINIKTLWGMNCNKIIYYWNITKIIIIQENYVGFVKSIITGGLMTVYGGKWIVGNKSKVTLKKINSLWNLWCDIWNEWSTSPVPVIVEANVCVRFHLQVTYDHFTLVIISNNSQTQA